MQIDPLNSATQGTTVPAAATRPAPAPVAAVPHSPPSDAEVQAAVAKINQVLKESHNSLQFEIDGETGKTIVRVIDEDTKEVLRQFPSEEVLAIARAIPLISGTLLNDTA